MTKTEIADLLNVAVPYVERILESGDLKSTNAHDVMEYKTKRDEKRQKALDALSQLLQDKGFYE
jgi:hypothetical protein